MKTLAALTALLLTSCASPKDPLPSWNNTPAKQALLAFVKTAAAQVPIADRIAVFDNDGTLWVEQPLYVQLLFAASEMKTRAPQHPEWRANPNFVKIIDGPPDAILSLAPADQFAAGFAVHAGRTVEEYSTAASRWLATNQHPRFHKPYTQLAYQPMLELIAHLRENGFQVYSVTGAEIGFVRVANELAFGIPRQHVIATLLKSKFEAARLQALPDVLLIDDGDGKPISIQNVIGRRPILAIGNSDGDLPMLQHTANGPGPRFTALVHHDDPDREFAYDRASPVGHLDKALDVANDSGWPVLSMKNDWRQIFPNTRE
jgi:phosphoglycolate phosphatase-like HAD superfamily hydrolase